MDYLSYLIYLLKGLVSKYSHILKRYRVGTPPCGSGDRSGGKGGAVQPTTEGGKEAVASFLWKFTNITK